MYISQASYDMGGHMCMCYTTEFAWRNEMQPTPTRELHTFCTYYKEFPPVHMPDITFEMAKHFRNDVQNEVYVTYSLVQKWGSC